jgi:inhibitor of KinA sporulation pathway (predicted exonuclease)
MKLTCLDLEMNQPSGKIIQIGAVIGDTSSGVISGRLRIYVNPNELLNPDIINLCKISQEQVDNGLSLEEAYIQLKDFHKNADFINPVTWGGADSQELFDQLDPTVRTDWCFGRRWIDAKTVAVTRMIVREDRVLSGGLSTTMKRFGLKFQGEAHDAQTDAENTFRIYNHMLYLMRSGSF